MGVLRYYIIAAIAGLLTFVAKAQHTAPVQLPSLIDELQRENYDVNPVLDANETPAEKIRKNIFIKVSANKTSCFVGEPVLVTYELFSGLRSQSKVSKQPAFSGCSVIEMTTDEPPALQKRGDKLYRIFLIRRVQLIPLQEGSLKLGNALVDNEVTFSSVTNPYQTQDFSATVSSVPLIINVKALPDKNKPSNFSGIIGRFHITSKVDSLTIAKGENNVLQVNIEGEGNFESITAPYIEWPKGTEHFDANDSQHIDKLRFPSHGGVTFNIPFIGTKKGYITIPVISFTYFDAATVNYITVKTKDIHVLVTHALTKTERAKNIVTEDITNRKYLWIVPAIALTVGFVWIVSSKKNRKHEVNKPGNKKQLPAEDVIQELQAAEAGAVKQTDFLNELHLLEGVADSQEFFTQTKAILTLALQEKLKLESESETILLNALQQQTKDVTLLASVETIYKVCNRSLYSPIANEEVKTLIHKQLSNIIEMVV